MRVWASIIFLIVAMYLVTGSGDKAFVTDEQIEASVSVVKEEARNVLEATQIFAEEKKEEYREKLYSDLGSLQSEIRDLKKRHSKASDKEKEELLQRLEAIQEEEEALRERLGTLEYTDKSYWVKKKEAYTEKFSSLRKTYRVLTAWFERDE